MTPYSKKSFAILFAACLLFCATAFSQPPDRNYIDSLSQQADTIASTFFSDSLPARLTWYYAGRLTDTSGIYLATLATDAHKSLEKILLSQQQSLSQIEKYTGPDWDSLFGETGLWRKLSADIEKTRFLLFRLDLCASLAQHGKTHQLKPILDYCDSFPPAALPAPCKLLKAEALTRADNPESRRAAASYIDTLLLENLLNDQLYIPLKILSFELTPPKDSAALDPLSLRLSQSSLKDAPEFNARLSFIALKISRPELLESAVQKSPPLKSLITSAILEGLTAESVDLSTKTPVEIDLAALAALEKDASLYTSFLEELVSIEKFNSPVVLYAAAVARLDTSGGDALSLMLRAARLQNQTESSYLPIDALSIARRAAALACDIYRRNPSDPKSAADAMDYYCLLAGASADARLQYSFASLLIENSRPDLACEILTSLAAGQSLFSAPARFDLLLIRLRENPSAPAHSSTIAKLREFITSLETASPPNTLLRAKAVRLYCTILLDSADPDSARAVIDILNRRPADLDADFLLIESRAFEILCDWPAAVASLKTAADPNLCTAANHAFSLVDQLCQSLDELKESLPAFDSFIEDSVALADYSASCLSADKKQRAFLLRAELELFKSVPSIPLAESLITPAADENSILYLRCLARLNYAQGNFAASAQYWFEITRLLEPPPDPASTKPPQWWQGRVNQLIAAALDPAADRPLIAHAVEVLQKGYGDIPPFWAEKLHRLAKTLAP